MRNLPPGISEEKFISIVNDIVSKLSRKLLLVSHDMSDIRQQGWVLALEGVAKFDPNTQPDKPLEQALENFLRVHVINRLKSYRRDRLGSSEKPTSPKSLLSWERRMQARRNILYPVDVYSLKQEIYFHDATIEDTHYRDLTQLIQQKLPVALRNDFLRMCDGVRIPKSRQTKVRAAIASIIDWKVTNEEIDATEKEKDGTQEETES